MKDEDKSEDEKRLVSILVKVKEKPLKQNVSVDFTVCFLGCKEL